VVSAPFCNGGGRTTPEKGAIPEGRALEQGKHEFTDLFKINYARKPLLRALIKIN
jgi:hypothetical protein